MPASVFTFNPLLNTYRDGKIEGVKYAQLTAVIVNAVKEQQKEIKALVNQTLNVNGYARLSLNSSAPVPCSGANQGAIALTHLARMCACNGSRWIFADSTGAVCNW